MTETTEQRLAQGLTVAKMYYQADQSQSQIAQQLGISRPTVSRLLQFAREQGLVRIQIVDPVQDVQTLEQALTAAYHVEVHVVPTQLTANAELLNTVGSYAARYLEDIVQEHDVIGIGWGKTIYAIGSNLAPDTLTGVEVIQLKGSVSYSTEHTYAYESIDAFANAFHAVPQYLPLPVIFDHQQTKELVEKERHIQYLLELGEKANIAIYSVGTVRNNALVFQLGYLREPEKAALQAHAVGDIFSRYIDENGEIVDPQLNGRTIGINLASLKQKEHSILVAAGDAKVPAVKAALLGGYPNCLIIDQHAAAQLLKVSPNAVAN
ncbi:MAG: sugar-binding transcriptional regulator [Levilactobacillus sp.]|jgi:deoxyribonucleoside regulator|uniref:sugar-binding transcriptional regulator n=1 Tax=Levilactobacillus sp. TaxID=2767919 RepID=UPI00258D5B9E|nr:sugar-binding transcriptional regulator [Levilactobacillus sp.]MCH4123873.1 sugar-binding transcriptional regulator [Levilactobacillus sp.]MCI1553971.1 sugar-binding transcriptional regulator [Levilactobacillus sp.]MCI1599162.1 sugar-binding transcriptional regulator [Levilactobacillus sp.]MCI1605447.1 sugar-binding transcriptional regulator [Levilactobacillus sp.]